MGAIRSFATKQPGLFVVCTSIAWFMLAVVFMVFASSALRKPYGDATASNFSRLVVSICTLWLVWRLGWLEASGITRLGTWPIWLLAVAGLIYFTCASLYAYYGKVAFDFSSLVRLPDSRTIVMTNFAAALSEEIIFRGLVLYSLSRVWGNTRVGLVGSVLFAALLFAILHLTQVFTNEISPSSALLLTLETFIISAWWGALVLVGGSIWPAVLLHFVVNAVVAVQGIQTLLVEPGILAYQRIFWLSLPLGLLGLGLLLGVEGIMDQEKRV